MNLNRRMSWWKRGKNWASGGELDKEELERIEKKLRAEKDAAFRRLKGVKRRGDETYNLVREWLRQTPKWREMQDKTLCKIISAESKRLYLSGKLSSPRSVRSIWYYVAYFRFGRNYNAICTSPMFKRDYDVV